MTKLLLSLLALLTGFSAAEAARPVETMPAALGSAAAFAAVIVADQVAAQTAGCGAQFAAFPVAPTRLGIEHDIAARPACIHRGDRSRE